MDYAISGWWYVVLVVAFGTMMAIGSAVLSLGFFVTVRSKAKNQSDCIALTFDDGPVSGMTEKILEILQGHNIPAAFFCIGNRVTDHPALVRQMHEAGHLIGNHSYWHKATFDLQSTAKIEKELRDTDAAIHTAIGVRPKFFRPPYGVTNPMVASAIARRAYTVIGWSIRSFDTVIHDPEKLFRRITKSLKGGDVILLHDHSKATVEILPKLLEYISKRGLKIVRVDHLFNEKAYV